MAPIYLARKIAITKKGGPNLFMSKGISGYSPSTLSSLAIVGIPHERQIAYGAYAQNVDAFIYATSKKEKISTEADGFPNFLMKKQFTRILPPVIFAPAFEVTPDQEDGIMKKLGTGTTKNKIGKRTVFTIANPIDSVLAIILGNQDPAFAAGDEALTPAGYEAALFLNNAISGFLATHTYAAFRTERPDQDGPMELRMLITAKGVPASVNNLKRESLDDYTFSGEFPEEIEACPEEDEEVSDREASIKKWKMTVEKKLLAIKIANATDMVASAKPSPADYTINYGSAGQMPTMGGLVFPYFEGSNLADPTIMKVVVAKYFIRLLGADIEAVQDRYVSMRRGFNSLATTRVGMEYAHMLAGIALGMECQARVYMVVEGDTYKGFSLLGGRFSVFDGANMVKALPAVLLRSDFSTFDPHFAAISALAVEFEGLRTAGHLAGEDLVQSEDVDTIEKITRKLKEIKIKPSEDESVETVTKKLDVALRSLSFTPLYRQIAPWSLQFVIDALNDTSIEIPKDYPFYFPSWDTDYEDRMTRLMIGFGSEAPSPVNVSGSTISVSAVEDIEVKDGKRVPTGKFNLYGNLPERLIFAPKLTEVAIKEWKRSIQDGAVKMDLKERARAYRAMQIEDKAVREKLWSSMVNLFEKGKVTAKKPAQKKAKIGEKAAKNADEFMKL